jgi:hypothetical protein
MADYARRVASLYWLVTIVLTLYKPYIYTQVFIYIYGETPLKGLTMISPVDF